MSFLRRRRSPIQHQNGEFTSLSYEFVIGSDSIRHFRRAETFILPKILALVLVLARYQHVQYCTSQALYR